MSNVTREASDAGFSITEEGARQSAFFMEALFSKMADWILKKKKFRAVIEYDPEGRANVKFEEVAK